MNKQMGYEDKLRNQMNVQIIDNSHSQVCLGNADSSVCVTKTNFVTRFKKNLFPSSSWER